MAIPRQHAARRKFLVKSIIGLGRLTLGPALVVRAANAQGETIKFITPFNYLIGFAPVLNAAAGGHFEAEGLNVSVLGGKGGAMAVQQTLAGRVQFARASSIDMIKAVGAGNAPLVAIATIMQSSVFSVVSPEAAPIHNPREMVGKIIGVTSRGGGTENILDMMLIRHGVDPASVRREAVGNSAGAYGLISAGRIDAYMPNTGTVTRLLTMGEKIHHWNTDREIMMPGQIYFMNKEESGLHFDLIVGFLRAIKSSIDEITGSDPLDIVDRLSQHFDIIGVRDRGFTGKALQEEMKLVYAEGEQNVLRNIPRRWQSVSEFMTKAGLLHPTPAAKLYTNEFVDRI